MARKSVTKVQSVSMMLQTLSGRFMFRLSLLAMLCIPPILFPSSSEFADLDGGWLTQRRLSSEPSSYDARPEEKHRLEAKAEHIHRYEKECLPLIKEGVDIINATEAENCSNVCGDTVAAEVILNSFIGTWHSKLLQRLSASPSLGTLYLYCSSLCIAMFGTCAFVAFQRSVVNAPEAIDTLVTALCGFLFVQFCIIHFWVCCIIGLCLSAAAWTSNPAGATASAPWAYPIINLFLKLKLVAPQVPFLLSFLVVFTLAIWLLAKALKVIYVYTERHDEGSNWKNITWYGVLSQVTTVWVAAPLLATALAWLPEALIFPLALLYSSGSHGPVWICSKTQVAAFMRWLPRTGAYGAGFSYAMAAVLHGLLLDYKRASQQRFHGPSNERKCYGITDVRSASSLLYLKFAGIFLDITFDFAQIVLFLMLGEPFFALYNLAGILLQIFLFIISMVRGSIPEASFFTIVLQSDAIVHFRSSVDIGFPVSELYEKIYRESFGETYISMTVAICAVFTVPVKNVTDAVIFIFSVMLSLIAVRTGVAEAFEYSSAEQAFVWATGERLTAALPNLRTRLIPMNHYYRRQDFGNERKLGWISTMRICEALVPVNALAVGCASASVKTTFLVAASVALSTLVLPIVLPVVADVIKEKGCVLCLREAWGGIPSIPRCDSFKKFYDVLCTVLLRVAWLAFVIVALFVAFLLSPLLFIIMYPYSITNPGTNYEMLEGTPFTFKNFILSKSLFAFILWCVMLLGFVHPHLSPFELHHFIWDSLTAMRNMKEAVFKEISETEIHAWEFLSIFELVQGLIANKEHTAGILALVRLGLAGSSLIGMVFLILTSYMLQDSQEKWHMEDRAHADQLHKDCIRLSHAVDELCLRFKFMAEVRFETDYGPGVRHNADGNWLAQIMLARVLDYIYGPEDRPGRERDSTSDNYNIWEEVLRGLAELEVTSQSISPEDLAEDIRMVMREFEKSRGRPPHLIALCRKLEECAKWLDDLCVFDFAEWQKEQKGNSSESWLGCVCRCCGLRQPDREEIVFGLLNRVPETDADAGTTDDEGCAHHTVGSERVADKFASDINELVNGALKEESHHALLIVDHLFNQVPRETLRDILHIAFTCATPENIFGQLKSPTPELHSRILTDLKAHRQVQSQNSWRAQQLDEIISAIERAFYQSAGDLGLAEALALRRPHTGSTSSIVSAAFKGTLLNTSFATDSVEEDVANILEQLKVQRELAKEVPARLQLLDELIQMLSGMAVVTKDTLKALALRHVNEGALPHRLILMSGINGILVGDERDKEEVANVLEQLKAQRELAKEDPARLQLIDRLMQMLSGMALVTKDTLETLALRKVNQNALSHINIIRSSFFRRQREFDKDDEEEVANILEQLKAAQRELADPARIQLVNKLIQILSRQIVLESDERGWQIRYIDSGSYY